MFSHRPRSHFDQNTPAPSRDQNEAEMNDTEMRPNHRGYRSDNPLKNRFNLNEGNNLSKTAMRGGTEQRRRRFGNDLTNTAQRLHSIQLDSNPFKLGATQPQKLSFQSARPQNRQQSALHTHNQSKPNKNKNNDGVASNPFSFGSLLNTHTKPPASNRNLRHRNFMRNHNQMQHINDNSLDTQSKSGHEAETLCEPEIGPNHEKYGSWEPSVPEEDQILLETAFEMIGKYRTFVPSRPLINIDLSDLNEPRPDSFDLLPETSIPDILSIIDSSGSEAETEPEADDNVMQVETEQKNDIALIGMEDEVDTDMQNNLGILMNGAYSGPDIGSNKFEIEELIENDCHLPINDESNAINSPFPQLFWLEADIIE